jgi:hypothetical protein
MATANMGLRESMNNHKGATAGAITVLVLIVAAVAAWQLTGSSSSGASGTAGKLYFTTDDGATTFTAPANRLPPFDHNGKPAVRAVMYSSDGGKTKFIGYLERYSEAALQQIEAAKQAAKPGGKMVMSAPRMNAAVIEVKKPGDKDWVDKSSAAGVAVMKVAAPGGGTGTPEIVTP